jgi:uncharacterized membrane protein
VRFLLSDRALLLLLLLLNAGLKFVWLGVNDLSGDEPFTAYWSQQPVQDLFAMLQHENNPPLYFLLVKAWSSISPLTEAWLRVPSAVFSVLTVWPFFLLVRALSDRWSAVVACLLFTLNNHQYIFAHEVRGYSLLVLLCALAFWLTAREVSRGSGPKPYAWIALSAVFVLMVYTHFFGWLVIGLLGLCVFAVREWHAARRMWCFSAIAALLAYAPYGFIFLQRAAQSIAHGTWVEPHGADEIWHMVRRWTNQPVVTLLLLAPVIRVLTTDHLRSIAVRIGLLWLLVPLLGLWLLQWNIPVYVDRYLLFASPGLYLLLGHSLVNVRLPARFNWLPAAVGIFAMAFTFTPWKDNDQHPSLAAARVRAWQRSSIDPPVLVLPSWYKHTLQWHLDKSRFADLLLSTEYGPVLNNASLPLTDDAVREVIVVSTTDTSSWSGPEVELLRARFVPSELVQTDPHVRVHRFTR